MYDPHCLSFLNWILQSKEKLYLYMPVAIKQWQLQIYFDGRGGGRGILELFFTKKGVVSILKVLQNVYSVVFE